MYITVELHNKSSDKIRFNEEPEHIINPPISYN